MQPTKKSLNNKKVQAAIGPILIPRMPRRCVLCDELFLAGAIINYSGHVTCLVTMTIDFNPCRGSIMRSGADSWFCNLCEQTVTIFITMQDLPVNCVAML